MTYEFSDCSMCVVFLLTSMLLFSAYPVMAVDNTRGCYRTTAANLSPRTCDSDSKNCKVPVTVSAAHKPGMSLCFQGIDATYEVYPVNASSFPELVSIENECRPLKPLKSVPSIKDSCFDGVFGPMAAAIEASGIKQQGMYTICKSKLQKGYICIAGALGDEQNCQFGLHTWVANCTTPTSDCPDGFKVAAYYCPEITTYAVDELKYDTFDYIFEVKRTLFSSTIPGVVTSMVPTTTNGDQPNPYGGWTFITSNPYGESKYFARPQPVNPGDCSDYCATLDTELALHTQHKCYTPSADLCASTRELSWQEFNTSWDDDRVALPYTAEDGSVLDTHAEFTTTKIVNPFTYTAKIDLDANQTDSEITSGCGPITADDVGIHAQDSLLYVRRVCDQVVLSLYDCVLRYSHHDGSAMYWSVNKTDNVSACTVFVVDNTSVLEVLLSITPTAEYDSVSSTKKLPRWAIGVIVAFIVIAIAIVVIAVLCMCLRKSKDEENADTKLSDLKLPQGRTLSDADVKIDGSEQSPHVADIFIASPTEEIIARIPNPRG